MNNNNRLSKQELLLQKRKQAYLKRKARKAKFKRGFIKFLVFIVVFTLVFIFYQNGFSFKNFNIKGINLEGFKFDLFKKSDKKDNNSNNSLEGEVISYIPIDDRDIHTTRLIYLAESGGYDLKMPNAKFYSTHIDIGENSYIEYNTKYGNPLKLASWLLEQEKDGCDYYIISLDQLFSGGLLGSEYLNDEDFEVYGDAIEKAKRAFEKIIYKKENHVYLIDSVIGLSPTPNFMDFTMDDYSFFYNYSSIPRPNLSESDLIPKKITESYILNKDGTIINSNIDSEKVTKYLKARERKLKLYDYTIKQIGKSKNNNIHIFYGINNTGSNTDNIQSNDIAYINKLLKDNKVEGIVQNGVYSLPIEVLGYMVRNSVNKDITVKVSYFGDKNQIATGSTNTYENDLNKLLTDMNIKVSSTDQCDFEILVYTKSFDGAMIEQNTKALINRYLSNIKSRTPTIIINDANYLEDKLLINYLTNYDIAHIPIGYLIGYSNWNGFVHSSKISLTEGITRYIYLTGSKKNDKCDNWFMKVMGESYVEDMAFIATNRSYDDQGAILSNISNMSKLLNNNLNKGNFITNLVKYEEKSLRAFNTYNYVFPWSRANEISFDVSITVEDAKKINIPDAI